jgi:class 3 adenylate cyclase
MSGRRYLPLMATSHGRDVPDRLRGLELRWTDAAIEADYRRWRVDRALPFVRVSMYGSAVGWGAFAVASVWIGPHLSRPATVAMLVAIFPMLALVLAATYHTRWRRWSLHLCAASNLIAGLAAVLILRRAGAAVDESVYADIGAMAVVLFVYFACTIMRLPPSFAAAAVLPYVALQQSFVIDGLAGDVARQVAFSALLWIAVATGLMVAAVLDRVSRQTFRQERVITAQREVIEQERARSERLLLNILPEPIAEELKHRPGTIAETHEEATVVFADLVGFTALASRMSATETVDLLNDVFSRFDALTEEHGIEKIKTIGDAYMAVAGLPTPRRDHVEAAADLALAMRNCLDGINAETGRVLGCRIGLHTGPVVAGVIGTAKFAYDLWGDTVNVAARMESHGISGEVQTTDEVARRLRRRGYVLHERGVLEVKGKGATRTWLLSSGPDGGKASPAPEVGRRTGV